MLIQVEATGYNIFQVIESIEPEEPVQFGSATNFAGAV
jgi:hypothetical protein